MFPSLSDEQRRFIATVRELAQGEFRERAPLDRFRRVGGDDAGLGPDLAQDRHRRHVAGLGDLLEDQGGVEDRQPQPAIFLRDRHSEHAQPGESPHVLPWKGSIHVSQRARAEFRLRKLAHRLHEAALLIR